MLRRALSLALILLLLSPPGSAGAVQLDDDESTAVGHRKEVDEPSAVPDASVGADLFSGAATFSIPISVPPGTAGFTPSVALQYSSQAMGDSFVGYGWSLGFGAVSRSLKRGVPTYTDDDTFVLGGEELVRLPGETTSGGVTRVPYETRRRSFRKIEHVYAGVANAQAGWWEVVEKNGIKSIFKRVVGPDSTHNFQWDLAEQEDLSKNVVEYLFTVEDGIAYPSSIGYTKRRATDGSLVSLPSTRVVEFVKETAARPDQPVSYRAGFRQGLLRRLSHIDVKAAGVLLRRYKLSYTPSPDSFRSLLTTVSLYGSDAAAPAPTAPIVTTFAYHSNQVGDNLGWETTASSAWTGSWPAGWAFVTNNDRDGGVRIADVNGDGRADLVRAKGEKAAGYCGDVSFPATGTSNGVRLAKPVSQGGGWENDESDVYTLPSWSYTCSDWNPSTPDVTRNMVLHFVSARESLDFGTGLSLTDMNGDGRADFFGILGETNKRNATDQLFENKWCISTEQGIECLGGDPGASSYYKDGSSYTTRGGRRVREAAIGSNPCEENTYTLTPGEGGWGGNTRLGDLDGDGLPDLVVRGREAMYSAELLTLPDSCNQDPPLEQILSIRSYVAYNRSAPGSFASGGDLEFQTATLRHEGLGEKYGFETIDVALSDDFLPCDPTDPNGDPNACSSDTLFNQPFLHYNGLEDRYYTTGIQEWGVQVVDVNGDGLDDQIVARREPDGSDPGSAPDESLRAWINDGSGDLVEDSAWALPVPTVIHKETSSILIRGRVAEDDGVRLADVNGDGRVDVIRVRDGGRDVWLNDGDVEDGGPWRHYTGNAGLTSELDFTTTDLGRDRGVRFADVDGDGMLDIVRARGTSVAVYLNKGSTPDILEKVTNPRLGTTSLAYKASTEFPAWSGEAPALPYAFPVLTSLSVDPDGAGPSLAATTTYAYEGGSFDARDRELRGFRRVTVDDPIGRRTVTEFHQTADRAGLEKSISKLSLAAGLYLVWSTVTRDYTAPGASPPYLTFPRKETRSDWDGAFTSPRISETEFQYDFDPALLPSSYGNRTAIIERGEITSPGVPLEPLYARTTRVDYAPDDMARHLVDRIAERRLVQGGPTSTVLKRRTRYAYLDTDAPGLPSEERVLIDTAGSGTEAITRYEYDAYGNPTEMRTPNAVASGATAERTRYEYDVQYQTFKTAEVLPERGPDRDRLHQCVVSERLSGRCGSGSSRDGAERRHLVDLLRRVWSAPASSRAGSAGVHDLVLYPRSEDDEPEGLHARRLPREQEDRGRPRPDRQRRELRRTGRARPEALDPRPGREGRTVDGPRFSTDPSRITTTAYDPLDRPTVVVRPLGRIRTTLTLPALTASSSSATRRITKAEERRVRQRPARGRDHRRHHLLDVLRVRRGGLARERDGRPGSRHLDPLRPRGPEDAAHHPDIGVTGYAYDRNGNLLARAIPGGTTETWEYDALDRSREALPRHPARG